VKQLKNKVLTDSFLSVTVIQEVDVLNLIHKFLRFIFGGTDQFDVFYCDLKLPDIRVNDKYKSIKPKDYQV
jgi:hypothetical protein